MTQLNKILPVRGHPTNDSLEDCPVAPETLHLNSWDSAVFPSDLLVSKSNTKKNFSQTSKGLSVAYEKIMTTIQAYYDIAEFEPSMAPNRRLSDKKKLYQFTRAKNYPPHLSLVPEQDKVTNKGIFRSSEEGEAIFNSVFRALLKKKTRIGAELFDIVRPSPFDIEGFKPSGNFQEIMEHHRESRRRKVKGGAMAKPSIGDVDDWYSDKRFAQQSLTGTNPTTIQRAGKEWIEAFIQQAKFQNLEAMGNLLSTANPESLYMQDCSYFRKAFGIDEKDTMSDESGFLKGSSRWACAAITLFHLDSHGALHPLAIVVDYKSSIANSVVLFNQRLTSRDTTHNQETDWPWRYAKTCAQVSDWIHHELQIHLTNTHLIEEGIIVASQRTLPSDHIIYKILSPHWEKTLSLNAAARETLVPKVIIPIIGVTEEESMRFINHVYSTFDFQGSYVPTDLQKRGFPLDKLGDLRCHCPNSCPPASECSKSCPSTCHKPCTPEFKNYTYARCITHLWDTLHTFVEGYLSTAGYSNTPAGQALLESDTYLHTWASEIRSKTGADIPSFPLLTTIPELVDAVTMCIHIASPQHTAVNYLQQYYQSFVVNKPPALYTPPPTTLSTLKAFTEKDLIKALPVSKEKDAEYNLASTLPALLSQTVGKESNLVTYAQNVVSAARLAGDEGLEMAAEAFCKSLWELGNTVSVDDGEEGRRWLKKGVFEVYSEELERGALGKYRVLDPVVTAVSVLI